MDHPVYCIEYRYNVFTLKNRLNMNQLTILCDFYVIGECSNNNCVEDSASVINKWSLPLLRSGDKKLYLGIFFKVIIWKQVNGKNRFELQTNILPIFVNLG